MKIFVLFTFCAFSLFAQQRYSQVRIPVSSVSELKKIAGLGIAVDHFQGKVGTAIDLFVNDDEIALLRQNNVPFTVLIADWNVHFTQLRKETPSTFLVSSTTPKNFRFGSMAGFLVYNEVLQQIDSMKLLYPSLVTAKDSIGHTIEGRAIYAVKISDNPSVNETDEPEVLYTALHHAREPEGMMTVIYYMWWLLENYGTDPEAAYLVDNRQMWFIPVVNPDGYIYNQTTNPAGGGMHRKNRRDVGTTNKGIDLNRNYGPHFMWNYPNPAGSSTTPDNSTYRGSEPFSEPETYAIRKFMESRDIKTCFNYHTSGNYLIYPWGFNSAESNDSLLYRYWTFEMSMSNRYSIGTDMQTVGYSTRGNSDDYMFSDSGKSVTYAMTPEVGTTGFWPSKSEIIPLAEENVLQNKLLAHYAGSFLGIESFSVNPGSVTIQLVNKGLQESPSSTIYFASSEGIISPAAITGTIPSFFNKEVTANFSASNQGESFSTPVKIYVQFSGSMVKDSIEFIAGTPTVLLYDTAATTALWSIGNGWDISTEIVGGNTSFTDSPDGKYLPNSDNSLTLLTAVDLTGFDLAELSFRTKWAIESTWDFGTIEVSTNNGISWTTLRTKLSRKGSGRIGGKQLPAAYGYDAFTPGLDWVVQTANLTPYVNKQIKIRFRMSADGGMEQDGWYVDDIRILGYHGAPNSVAENSLPYDFTLSQNFPNPFNPITTITFTLDKSHRTELTVYNSVGQAVATVINQELSAGKHSILFDAGLLSSGVYFYRLTAGNHRAIKKMTVVK